MFQVAVNWLQFWLFGFALSVSLVTLAGCGGGSSQDSGGGIQFSGEIEFDPQEEVVSLTEVEGVFTPDELRSETQLHLVSQGFLLDWISLILALEQRADRMEGLASQERERVDLIWVQQVHDLVQQSEILYLEGYRLQLPADAGESYQSAHRRFLIGVESFGFASERLIDSALIMGPGGRIYEDLSSREQVVFDATRNQAVFYLGDCIEVLTSVKEDLKDELAEIRFGQDDRPR